MIFFLQSFNANEKDITVVYEGNEILFDVPPQIISGRTLVPIRTICEALVYSVEGEKDTKQILISDGEIRATAFTFLSPK